MKSYKDKKDDMLVEMTLLGEDRAFEELVNRHARAVKGTAYKVTQNEYSAEDASQDAFVSAWVKLDSLRERDRFGAWVCSIAKNHARDLVSYYSNAIADVSFDLIDGTSIAADEELAEQLYLERERNETLHAALETLGEKIRETIRLHYFEGLSVSEIAKRLSLPAGTVKWRLCEGRRQLRKEYGIMEKKYDENLTLTERVMREVEALKLWGLKKDRSGFEEEYRRVLAKVESLDESREKQYTLADVLLRGYWWLPGEKNDEVFARIKEAAYASRNEDVVQAVVANEYGKYKGRERIEYIRDTQIPALKAEGFMKSLGYAYFWLGYYNIGEGDRDEGINCFRRVLDVLKPSDVYYANALSAIHVEEKQKAELNAGTSKRKFGISATGEVLRFIDGKLYFWSQPGYSRCHYYTDHSLFWNASQCDGLILDPDMKVGGKTVSSDGKSTLTCTRKGERIETPAGIFEDCTVFEFSGEVNGVTYCETAFADGVGLVRQKTTRNGKNISEWVLSSCNILGGEGLLPCTAGNRWEYTYLPKDGIRYETENYFEMTAFDGEYAVVSSAYTGKTIGYDEKSWEACMLYARRNYVIEVSDDEERLADRAEIEGALTSAASLALTKRQKRHTAIATEVMKRIFDTDPHATPNCAQMGCWNFFDIHHPVRDGGNIKLDALNERRFSFEWKNMETYDNEARKVLYNFLYDILNDAVGCVWSDEWVPGYHFECEKKKYQNMYPSLLLDVLEDETVETPVGRFEGCRHIVYELEGLKGGIGYRGGKMEYWFAPGVGIVKLTVLYDKRTKMGTWVLTDYLGEGEGYFPIADGLFRRYEPTELGHGWQASVEYTFDVEGDEAIIFRNALGCQDIDDFMRIKAQKEKERAEKRAAREQK